MHSDRGFTQNKGQKYNDCTTWSTTFNPELIRVNLVKELRRRLPAMLHVAMTLFAVPYLLLAGFFMMVGRMASQRGPWAILDSFLESFNWAASWGLLMLGVTVITVAGLGLWESQRWLATLALAVLMAVSLSILLFLRITIPTLGELVFLSPGILILAYCCWRLYSKI